MLDLGNKAWPGLIREVALDATTKAVTILIRPLHDDCVTLYFEKTSDGYTIHDNGETFGALTSNFGLNEDSLSKAQEEYLRYLISFNKVLMENGVFKVHAHDDTEEIILHASRLFQCIIQVYSIYAIKEPAVDQHGTNVQRLVF